MKNKKYLLVSFFIVAICCAPKNEVLVTIDHNQYTVVDFNAFYKFSPTEDSAKRMDIINSFVDQKLATAEARALGYEQDPVVKSALETNLKDIISRSFYEAAVINKIKISDAEIRKTYNKMFENYNLAQIVVASESLAKFVDQELKKGIPFDSLLKFSLDTVSQGGKIGSVPAMQLPPEILEALQKTKVGGVSGMIEYGGYFIFLQVIEHNITDNPQVKFNDVKETIKNSLLRQKAAERADKYIQGLISHAKIEYNQEGLDALTKPDSLLTEADMDKWVVKKYDTAYVYVRSVINAIRIQYQRSAMDPKKLIDRVLIPDLLYEEAIRQHFDRKPETRKKIENALDMLIYQKLYSDAVIAKAVIDSSEAVNYYKQHRDEYKNQKFSEAYPGIKNKLRETRITALRTALFEDLRKKYTPKLNDAAVTQLLQSFKIEKEEK